MWELHWERQKTILLFWLCDVGKMVSKFHILILVKITFFFLLSCLKCESLLNKHHICNKHEIKKTVVFVCTWLHKPLLLTLSYNILPYDGRWAVSLETDTFRPKLPMKSTEPFTDYVLCCFLPLFFKCYSH